MGPRLGCFLFALLLVSPLASVANASSDPLQDWRETGRFIEPMVQTDSSAVPAEPVAVELQTNLTENPEPQIEGQESSSNARNFLAEPVTVPVRHEGFHWRAAILQSMSFMAMEQGFLLSTDKWARNSIEHGNYIQDYANAVEHTFSQWDDGDPFLDNYIGHPLQGSLTGYIQVQNDPQGRRLMFSNTHEYWMSRLKAMAWNAAFSTQFEIGPLGEAAIENLGGFQYRNCATCRMVQGAGWVDLVVTPTGGFGWMVMEDVLDRYVVAKTERRHGRGFVANLLRVSLNPTRSAANVLRGRAPWYRDSRDEIRVGDLKPLPGAAAAGGGK